jgi:hypothetical protein
MAVCVMLATGTAPVVSVLTDATAASKRPYKVTEDWACAAPAMADKAANAIRVFFIQNLQGLIKSDRFFCLAHSCNQKLSEFKQRDMTEAKPFAPNARFGA